MIRALAIAVMLAVTAVLAAPFLHRAAQTDGHAGRLLEDGRERAARGDWVQARVRFEEILSADPENAEARLGLARALRAAGSYEAAAAHLLHLVERTAGAVEARVEFGELLFLAGELDRSRAELETVIAAGAAGPRIDALGAAHAAVEGEDDRARALAEAALAGDPALSQAYATLASIDLRAGALGAALATLDRAAEAGADTLSLGLLRLGIYERLGRDVEIGEELAALAERHPGMPELQLARVRWILDRDPLDTALASDILGDLLARSESPAERIELTGEMVRMIGVDGARVVVGGLAADPALAGAFENELAALEMASGDRDAAIGRLEREIAAEGDDGAADASRLLLARLLDPADDLERRAALAGAVLSSDPGNPSAHLLLSDVDLRRGEHDSAIAHLRAALTAVPEATGVILELARAHALSGSDELSQDRLAMAMRTSGHAPDIVLRYAGLIGARQGPAAAADLIDIGLEAHPRDTPLLVRRAQLALALGDLRSARRVRARLSAIPEAASTVRALDLALAAQAGGAERAVSLLEEAWRASGEEADLLALGAAYIRAGRAGDALELLDRAVAEGPERSAVRAARADAHLALGSFEAADADLTAAGEAAPGDVSLRIALARLRLSLGHVERADAAIAQGLAIDPADHELGVLRAGRLEAAGSEAEAIAAYERLARSAPGDPRVAARLGLLLVGEGRPEADIRRALRVTALLESAADPALSEIRAWVLHRAGQSAKAARILSDLSAGRPDDATLAARLGLSALAAGQPERAGAALARAARLSATEGTPLDPDLARAARQARGRLAASD